MSTNQTPTVTLAIGMRVEDLSNDDSVRGTVIAMGKRWIIIATEDGEERPIDGLDNVGIIPTATT